MTPSQRSTQFNPKDGHDTRAETEKGSQGGTVGQENLTTLLERLRQGDPQAMSDLFPLVYGELRRVARRRRGSRAASATLNTTAVVHELYLKLSGTSSADWQSRAHFFAVAAQAMRQILTDHARRRTAEKRGGEQSPISLDEAFVPSVQREADWLLDLNQALGELSDLSPRLAQVVECRYFAGMTDEEVAVVVGTTGRTVRRDWLKARAWLYRRLDSAGPVGSKLPSEVAPPG